MLLDSKSEKEMNLLDSFRKDEDLMNLDIRDRKPNGVIADITEDVYTVCSTGATISCQTSISLLYHYCSKLPHDEFFNPKPDIFNVDDTEGIICHIILPSNAPIHHIVGGRQSSKEAAKKDACLRACKELHQVGALTDFLLPEQDGVKKEDSFDVPDSDSSEDEDSPVALQEMVVPATLKEPWYDEKEFIIATELLMVQLLKLDSIEAEGEAKTQRKNEAGCCLKCGSANDLKSLHTTVDEAYLCVKSLQEAVVSNGLYADLLSIALRSVNDLKSTLHSYNKKLAEAEDILAQAFCSIGDMRQAIENCTVSIE